MSLPRGPHLYITEKPAVARVVEEALCVVHGCKSSRRDGYVELENGDQVVALAGHLVEGEFIPDELRKLKMSEYFAHLPYTYPDGIKVSPRPERDRKTGKAVVRGGKPVPNRQYKVAVDLIRKARSIVNAGDSDREGQLIVDEMLEAAGICLDETTWRVPVHRIALVSDKVEDVVKVLKGPWDSNGDSRWVGKRLAAQARSLIDKLVGLNGSMAYQAASGNPRTSIGRVQTPVVCLVVAQERRIRAFKEQVFYVPVVTLADGVSMEFVKRRGCEGKPGFDDQGRILDEAVAKQIVRAMLSGQQGQVTRADVKRSKEAPPLPFSGSDLASTVSKRTGATPGEVSKAMESVRLNHKAISYTGTDCRYLPESLLEQRRDTMAMLSRAFGRPAQGADLSLTSAAWNDGKLDEHHAIIPTGPLGGGASELEREVYRAVSLRYIAQFYPAAEHLKTQLEALFGQDEFKASATETVVQGWREVEGNLERGGAGVIEGEGESDNDDQAPSAREKEKG